jgi:acetyl esterase/lipase
MGDMSPQAVFMRFILRRLIKPRGRGGISLAAVRRKLALLGHLVPPPPRGTETVALDMDGVAAEAVATPAARRDRVVLHLHGGSYLVGFPALYRDTLWRLAEACRARVACIDYRLAPEHPFPAALDDAVTAYRWLLAQGMAPAHIVLSGDSAGGGLVFAALLRLRDERVPLPAAAVAVSPWTDLALTGDSFRAEADDPLIPVEAAPQAVALYLAGADPHNPYASPLYGDLAGLPPSLILVGGDDVLRDDARRMAERLRGAGCGVEYELWPGMWHVWPLLARVVPEARAAIARIGEFVTARM